MTQYSRVAKPICSTGGSGRAQPHRHSARQGAVAVEFALTSGLLFLIVFIAIEFMRVNSIVNSAENAAYEGARAGIVPGAVADDVTTAANAIVKAIGVRNATVSLQPTVINDHTPEVTVTVAVPLDDNSFIAPRFFLGDTLTKTCTLSREIVDTTANGGS
jgi:Flp pilus assembly protein TadG